MPATKPDWRWVLVPAFLVAQMLMVHALANSERPPVPPDLTRFQGGLDQWKVFREDPIALDVAKELKADQVLSQTYREASTGALAGLFVAWFQTQRGGDRQPHSPKVCLPASGWTPQAVDEVTLATVAGAITVNRYLVSNGAQRAAVLYWYQTPRRVIAGEWAAKLWLVTDAVRDLRTDTALVRVVVQTGAGGDQTATATASDFARSLYPVLRKSLPQ